MSEKHSVSSYSDLSKLPSDIREIHFRKFLSKRLMRSVLSKCGNLKIISISKYAYSRCDKDIIEKIRSKGIELKIRESRGRPSMIERWTK